MKKIKIFFLAGMAAVLISGCSGATWAESSGAKNDTAETAENRLEEVIAQGKLMIGISADYAPFAFEIPAEEEELPYAGSDIELGTYIAEQLGVEAEFCGMEFEECLEAVSEGTVDMVLLGMLPKQERELQMDFTDIYYQPGTQVLLVKKDKQREFSTLEGFAGKTAAAQYGSLQAQLVVEQLPESFLELTENLSEAVLKLRIGSVDGVAVEKALAEDLIAEYEELAIGAEFTYDSEGIVGGVVKDEPELLEKVNEILSGLAEENQYLNWLDEANEAARSVQTTR